MLMNNELVTVEKAVKTLRNLKANGKNLRGVYPVQETQVQHKDQLSDDFRVDFKNQNEKYFDEPNNSIYFRLTTAKTLKALENEIDTDIITEQFY